MSHGICPGCRQAEDECECIALASAGDITPVKLLKEELDRLRDIVTRMERLLNKIT